MYSTGNEIVDSLTSLHLEGNIIPSNWFNVFKMPNGKPDTNAVILLSEIVYWYRPTTMRDEETGRITGIKKRFKADFLQRSYTSFSDQFGFSKQQVKEALDRLESFGIIKKHFRTIDINNQKLSNVLFIELVSSVLFEITTLPISKGTPSPFQKAHPPHFKRETNTEITTETTTKSVANTPDEILNIWKPKIEDLNAWLRRSGEMPLTENLIEQVLLEFNPYYESRYRLGSVTENQMYSNFVKWVKRGVKLNHATSDQQIKINENVKVDMGSW